MYSFCEGQLGQNRFSEWEANPAKIEFFGPKDVVLEVACGAEHTIAIARVLRKDKSIQAFVYAWGDSSRGQLGSGDEE